MRYKRSEALGFWSGNLTRLRIEGIGAFMLEPSPPTVEGIDLRAIMLILEAREV